MAPGSLPRWPRSPLPPSSSERPTRGAPADGPPPCGERARAGARSGDGAEPPRGVAGETRKDLREVRDAHAPREDLREDVPEIGRHGEVAAFVEARRGEARPPPVDLPASYAASEEKHDVRVSMVGAAVSVLADCAAELG